MPPDAEVKKLLETLDRSDPRPRNSLTIAETREKYLQMQVLAGEPKDLARVENRAVPGPGGEVPIRVYAAQRGGQLPALVYLHGGRFISGNLETHDRVCRDLAFRSECLIVAVDYRLAPEHRFPAALEDVYSVISWAELEGKRAGIDVTRIGVGGDSAGGNLAAASALLARERKHPTLQCQLLVYPMLDATCSAASHQTMGSGYGAGSEDMQRGYREYLADDVDPKDPLASPLFAAELSGMPATFILTAEYDSLRDEAEQYAGRLRAAGVLVRQKRYKGAIHGFFQMAGALGLGRRAMEDAGGFLRQALAKEAPSSIRVQHPEEADR